MIAPELSLQELSRLPNMNLSDPTAKPHIVAFIDPPTACIQGMAVPNHLQGQGHGRRCYEEWEAALPSTVKAVTLRAVSTSVGFWTKMGYSVVDGDIMVKIIGGGDLVSTLTALMEADNEKLMADLTKELGNG